MLSTRLRIWLLLEFSLDWWLCGWWWPQAGLLGCALLALLLILGVRGILTLSSFTLAWWARTPRPAAAQIGVIAAGRLVWREYLAALRVYLWLQPLYPWRGRCPVPTGPALEEVPVLLIHGFLCNSGYWWPAVQQLRQAGRRQVYTVDLEPPLQAIESYVPLVVAKVREICAASGAAQVVLVGHSMGGLVARLVLAEPGMAARVGKLITLGAPHQGTVHAYFSASASAAQMRPGSVWLQALPRRLPTSTVPLVSVFSWHDNIVAPQQSASLPGSKTIGLSGVGHLELGLSPACVRVWQAELP